jgi:2-polyprenyl-6-methoxyphenol hydroxylase-like FAD-dependent oxidoreductase
VTVGSIAIVGTGVGGLAAAALLADQGHAITLYDQFDKPGLVGSGLVIQPVGQAVLDRIGAGDVARNLGAKIGRMVGQEVCRGRTVLDVLYDRNGGDRFGLAIHRASLFHALYQSATARGIAITTNSAVTGTRVDTSGRWLTLIDGAEVGPFDLVVDATGAASKLSPLTARPLAYGAIWSTVDWPCETTLPVDQLTQRYYRAARMAGVLPLGRIPGDDTPRAAIFWSLPVAAMSAWRTTPLSDWKTEAAAFWPEFAPFLDRVTFHDDMIVARYAHGTLARPYGPRIVYIGDAAHRASPQLGQGANMALLDAMALAEAMRTKPENPLAAYAAMRRWHVRLYQAMSWAFTPQYQSDSLWLPWLRDRIMMPVSRIPPMPATLTRLVGGDLIAPLAGVHFP